MLQSENNFIVVNDLAFDWLKPKVVMTNSETVRSSVLEERRKKFRSMTGSQQRRLSNLLMALNHGDFSFSSAYHGSLFALTAFTLPIPPHPNLLPYHPTPPPRCQTPCTPATCRCCHARCCSRRRVCAAVQSFGHILLRRRLCVLFLLPSCAGGALNTLPMLQALSHFISCPHVKLFI